eukprot:TRINITY_DN26399_c0_g1_i3.p2 TRINITY_DN26399_c0_g1~~TRINITY_DN26399_c0_g1_i3.p2  ORF type:complete len:215 (+),score=42.07 TRINITY_DN26399_c0_g1_i3:155-799(+)
MCIRDSINAEYGGGVGMVLQLLVIGKGLGGGKREYLEAHTDLECEVLDLPEPTDPEDIELGIDLVSIRLQTEPKPDLLVASSRGGKYAAELLSRGLWRGGTFLISAMGTGECCSSEGVPIQVVHGTLDRINTIERVRGDVDGCRMAELIEFEDSHSLRVLVDEDRLHELILQFAERVSQGSFGVAAQPDKPSYVPRHTHAQSMSAMFAELKARK